MGDPHHFVHIFPIGEAATGNLPESAIVVLGGWIGRYIDLACQSYSPETAMVVLGVGHVVIESARDLQQVMDIVIIICPHTAMVVGQIMLLCARTTRDSRRIASSITYWWKWEMLQSLLRGITRSISPTPRVTFRLVLLAWVLALYLLPCVLAPSQLNRRKRRRRRTQRWAVTLSVYLRGFAPKSIFFWVRLISYTDTTSVMQQCG